MEDTICAISTAIGTAGISIIRVSGNESIKIVNSIFKGKNLEEVENHTINYGHIVYNNEIIDEVLVSVMRSPKSFTMEDVVEINTHGGFSPTQKVLEILLLSGCRLAEKGEFTKRAYLNGRIDLLKAQAINDLTSCITDNQRKLAVNELEGKLSKKITDLMKYIIEISANIEVNIDYPEYEDEIVITHDILNDRLKKVKKEIELLLKNVNNGKIIKNGINISLVGKPNTGKSSLLNKLLEEDKAIVTNIPGTTRDIVEGKFILNGYLINLVDTAGIRKTKDIVEKMGISKSLEKIDESDLIIVVLNGGEPLDNEDFEILKKVKKSNHLIFINKSDLPQKINLEDLKDYKYIIGNTVSDNLSALKDEIIKKFDLNVLSEKEFVFLSSIEHQTILKEVLKIIEHIFCDIKNEVPIDMLTIDLKNIYELLGKIIGKSYDEDLLDEMFSNFCLGK